MVVSGIFLSYIVNWAFGGATGNWRWIFWLMISEIFPLKVRSAATPAGTPSGQGYPAGRGYLNSRGDPSAASRVWRTISREMVRIYKVQFGRGPTSCRRRST
jgi:hypothetical protein